MKPLKLLLVTQANPYFTSSASGNRMRSILDGLAKQGVEIHIIITQGFRSFDEFKRYRWKGNISEITYRYTIFLLHSSLWMRRISGYILAPLLKNTNAKLLRKKIIDFDPQIIWVHQNLDVLDVYLLAKAHLNQQNYKLMIELNEFHDIGLVHATNSLQLTLSKRYSKTLLTKILPKADFLVIMTRHLLEYYRQYTDANRALFLHMPMTVDMERFQLKKDKKDRYIAYCGSSSFVKDGVDILIRSFAAISGKYPEIKLKIAAFMEADGSKMLALINELKMQGKIEYVGELKRDEIPDFIINAELLLLPRPDSKQAQGGFPTKLGEYLATGNPVCATTVGEIPDYLKDGESVYFAEPGSVDSFADSMDRALSDPKKAAQIGKNGKHIADCNFNMDIQTERLFSFLNEHAL
ncbi:MAG: hypothetical protein FD170_3580 [Bacteroidetes bacterium]|nr:MAG: hypothetical protein FD170_3580 [Bacteroidota bacterium]